MGGGRKKKEKEQSFKRSDSFKRISIRKSYLDRGGKKRQQQKLTSTTIIQEEPKKDEEENVELRSIITVETEKKESNEGVGQSVIAYGNWLRGVRVADHATTGGTKGAERTVIYIPAADDPAPAPPVIRQLSSSPVFRKSPILHRKNKLLSSPTLKRKESNDSAVEMFPWGESIETTQKSPLIMRRPTQASPPLSLLPDASEDMCSLSVSLGRIWMDAPLAMSPRSLELPRPSTSTSTAIPAHHSLDSALKDRREDPIVMNRLQKKQTPPVTRTLSGTSTATASTGLFSSKDSGFSFSVSIPKLAESPQPKGFFRKKRPVPRLSVSRDGYFKRTSGSILDIKRNSVRRKSSRKKKLRSSTRKKRNRNNLKNDMYQVVVSRPPRSLTALKLDPMIFVPPEKRKPSVRRTKSFKLSVREIREYKSVPTRDSDADEGLYESISGELSPTSDHYYDLPSNDFSKSSTSSAVSASPVVSDDETTSTKSSSGSTGSCYLPPAAQAIPAKNRVVRRKKSLSRKKSIKYVAKPNIMRAPSTLRRSKKKKSGIDLFYIHFLFGENRW